MSTSGNRGKKLADIRDEMLAKDAAFRHAWEASAVKRNIAAGLVRLRRQANLNQRQLAQRAGWDPAFVSRLESVPASDDVTLPDLRTLVTYAQACGSEIGFVIGAAQEGAVHISETIALSEDRPFTAALERLEGQDIEPAAEATAGEALAADA